MYTSGYAHRSSSFSSAASKIARVSTENTTAGLISEVVYREDQPMMTQLLLLPLLQQLGQQSRWQLWLTPQQKLSREWVLPLPHCGVNGSRFTHGQLQCGDRLVGR